MSDSFRRVSKHFGFTLIELLVVIAIIAVLMGIIMPSLNRARQGAMGVSCKGNLKNYTLAVAMYLDDNDGKFNSSRLCYFNTTNALQPGENGVNDFEHLRWCNGDINLKNHPEYGGSLFSYIRNAGSFICPTFKRLSHMRSDDQFFKAAGASLKHYEPWYNYTQNGYLGPAHSNISGSARKITEVKRPATTFSFTEESCYVDTKYNQSGLNDTDMIPADQQMGWLAQVVNPKLIVPGPASEGGVGTFYDVIAGFHNAPSSDPYGGRGNCAFLDGHIDGHYRSETFYLAWPKK